MSSLNPIHGDELDVLIRKTLSNAIRVARPAASVREKLLRRASEQIAPHHLVTHWVDNPFTLTRTPESGWLVYAYLCAPHLSKILGFPVQIL